MGVAADVAARAAGDPDAAAAEPPPAAQAQAQGPLQIPNIETEAGSLANRVRVEKEAKTNVVVKARRARWPGRRVARAGLAAK